MTFPLFARSAAVAAAALFFLPVWPSSGAGPAPRAAFDPLGVYPGAAVAVVLSADLAPGAAVARAGGEEFPLIPLPGAPGGRWLALVGVDISYAGKVYPVEFPGVREEGDRPLVLELPLSPVEYGVQNLTLPKKMVEYPAEVVPRIERESASLRMAVAGRERGLPLARGFAAPVAGRLSAGFGGRRVLNGEERSPHGGEDIAAPLGTRVGAANDGRVALVGNFYLTGKTVVVDHGEGVFTLYAHLNKIRVNHGEKVARGQTVGTVGATGRATGPHLHFGVVIRGVKVDPESLKALAPLFEG